MIGPPIVTPNWFWTNCERGTPLSLLKKLLASKTVLRRYSYADPWKAFDPDLDVNETTPPEKLPNSGLGTLVTTRNSWTASCVGTKTVSLLMTSFNDDPSNSTAAWPARPPPIR